MRVIQCDKCKKRIPTDREVVEIRIGFSARAELCESCGKPIRDTLAKMKTGRQGVKKLKK